MQYLLFFLLEEITVSAVALVALGPLLHSWRSQTASEPMQLWLGRLASAAGTAGIAAYWLSRWSVHANDNVWRYSIPLGAAAIAVTFYAAFSSTRSTARPRPAVDVTPRTLWSFGSRWWFAGWVALNVLLLATVVLAGLASSTDELGRHVLIMMQIGSVQAGALFFGWSYGLPAGAAVITLAALVLLALGRIARPPMPTDPLSRNIEKSRRGDQTRTVLSLASGAVAFTLGAAWMFIGRSAQLGASVSGQDGIPIELGTSFAALAIPLTVMGLLLEGSGLALVVLPLVRRRDNSAIKRTARESADSVPAGS